MEKEKEENYREECGYILHKSCKLVVVQGESVRKWENRNKKKEEAMEEDS